ncbi:MAG: ribosome assembly cofactor RimP [Bacteroidia bacterium]
MITESTISKLVEESIAGSNKFIVEIKIKPVNKIEVLIDSLDKIAISDCVELSRHIEANLDREKDDFQLIVSSAGIDQPFRVHAQYTKNLGRNVEVTTTSGEKMTGKLLEENEEEITIESTRTERKEKGKGKQTITEKLKLPLNQIKETKLILSFK